MNPTDNEFFEAYKHLDKLCGEIFDCRNGISEYIAQMEKSSQGYRLVSNWDSDYKNLKHIRWVRNQIAHESSYYAISDREDIEFAELFYTRIMKQDDPFSRLRKSEQERTQRSILCNGDTFCPTANSISNHPTQKKRKNKVAFLFAFVLGIILLMLLLYFLFQ